MASSGDGSSALLQKAVWFGLGAATVVVAQQLCANWPSFASCMGSHARKAPSFKKLGKADKSVSFRDEDMVENRTLSVAAPLTHDLRGRTLTGDNEDKPLVVGVAGGTASGKTTMAQAIRKRFGEDNVTFLRHDMYYKDLSHLSLEERKTNNFDHPDSLDTGLLVEHLKKLLNNESVEVPVYDFTQHTRLQETTLIKPKKVILLEGILLFTNLELISLLDVKIFVDTSADVRFIRRLQRDIEERGRSVDSVIQQYIETVRPMHISFVEPSKRLADLIIPRGVNHVALDMVVSRLRAYVAAANGESSE